MLPSSVNLRSSLRVAFLLLCSAAGLRFFASEAFSQGVADPALNVRSLMDQLKKEPFMRVTANRLADAGAVEAIPLLETKYAEIKVPSPRGVLTSEAVLDKSIIASALVRLGDSKAEYWDFLAAQAEIVVGDRSPFPLSFDSSGDPVPRSLSADFLQWAQSNNVDPNLAAQDRFYAMPGLLLAMAVTGDPRGLMILRKGLSSGNYLVQTWAAKGLALLGDNASIGLIINACAKLGPMVSAAVAQALVFFDDPEAEAASKRFINNQEFLEGLRQRKAQFGRKGVF